MRPNNNFPFSYPLILLALIILFMEHPLYAADSTTKASLLKLKDIYQRQVIEKDKALKEKVDVEAHISKITAFRATLTLPKDTAADQKVQQALARDRDALQKADERIRLANSQINLTERAIRYMGDEKMLAFMDPKLSLEELGGLVKITQDALKGLANSRRNDQAERETWEKTVDAAANAAWERAREIPSGILNFLGGRLERQLEDANKEIRRAADMLKGEADPNRRERLDAAIKLLTHEKKDITLALNVVTNTERTKDVITAPEWTKSNAEHLQKYLEQTYNIGAKILKDPAIQKALKIGKDAGKFNIGVFAEQSKSIMDSSYDITSEIIGWKKISQLNKSSDEYLRDVQRLDNRITVLVDSIKNKP